MKNLLVGIENINNKSSSKNKNEVADKCSGSYSCNVNIVMAVFMLQNIFGEQHGTPSEPEWDLYRIQCTHDNAKPETMDASR